MDRLVVGSKLGPLHPHEINVFRTLKVGIQHLIASMLSLTIYIFDHQKTHSTRVVVVNAFVFLCFLITLWAHALPSLAGFSFFTECCSAQIFHSLNCSKKRKLLPTSLSVTSIRSTFNTGLRDKRFFFCCCLSVTLNVLNKSVPFTS
jgi:hypothetical protein